MTPAAAIRSAPPRSFVRASSLPGTPAAARQAASRAARSGSLVQVRRGLYYRGQSTRYGMTKPTAEEIAREILGTVGVGPADFSAARAWQVTTQIPPLYTVAVPFTVDPIDGVKQVARRNIARLRLNSLEIALLELLRSPETLVETGWADLVRRVGEASGRGDVRLDAVAEAAVRESSVATRGNFVRLERELSGTKIGE